MQRYPVEKRFGVLKVSFNQFRFVKEYIVFETTLLEVLLLSIQWFTFLFQVWLLTLKNFQKVVRV